MHYGCRTDCKLLIYGKFGWVQRRTKTKSNRNMCTLTWSVIFRSIYEFKQFSHFIVSGCVFVFFFSLSSTLLLSVHNNNNVKRAIHLDIFFASVAFISSTIAVPSKNVYCVRRCIAWNVWSISRRLKISNGRFVWVERFFFVVEKNDKSTDRRNGSVGFLYTKLAVV